MKNSQQSSTVREIRKAHERRTLLRGVFIGLLIMLTIIGLVGIGWVSSRLSAEDEASLLSTSTTLITSELAASSTSVPTPTELSTATLPAIVSPTVTSTPSPTSDIDYEKLTSCEKDLTDPGNYAIEISSPIFTPRLGTEFKLDTQPEAQWIITNTGQCGWSGLDFIPSLGAVQLPGLTGIKAGQAVPFLVRVPLDVAQQPLDWRWNIQLKTMNDERMTRDDFPQLQLVIDRPWLVSATATLGHTATPSLQIQQGTLRLVPLASNANDPFVIQGETIFVWEWSGPDPRPLGYGFEVRVQAASTQTWVALHDAKLDNEEWEGGIWHNGNRYGLTIDVPKALANEGMLPGTYIWAVVLIKFNPEIEDTGTTSQFEQIVVIFP